MNISLESLKQAVEIKEQIASLEARLSKILGRDGAVSISSSAPAKRGRKKMSAAGRARIAAAQKARWAKIKGTSPVAKPAKKKRHLSPEGRAAIVAALKKRWAAKRK